MKLQKRVHKTRAITLIAYPHMILSHNFLSFPIFFFPIRTVFTLMGKVLLHSLQIISKVMKSNHSYQRNLIVRVEWKHPCVHISWFFHIFLILTEVWDTSTYCCNENGCNESTIASISKYLLLATTMMISAKHLVNSV